MIAQSKISFKNCCPHSHAQIMFINFASAMCLEMNKFENKNEKIMHAAQIMKHSPTQSEYPTKTLKFLKVKAF